MDNKAILEQLNYYVVGHEEAKKTLISLVIRSQLRHYQKYMKNMEPEFLLSPMKVLLIGASGSGKTHLLECLQKIMPFPLVRLDATQLNPTGASGGLKPIDVQKLIVDAATEQCNMFPHVYFSNDGAVDRTVVFIDEVDKLGNCWESSGNWNKHVQSNFLTLLDNKQEFAGISFIFAGAFNELTKQQVTKEEIGFNKLAEKTKKDKTCIDEELIKGGLIPEMVGRITHIVELDKFDKDMYYFIIKEKLLPKKYMDLAAYGVFDAFIEEDLLQEIASKACKSNQGVRYLQRALDKHFLSLEFDACANATKQLSCWGV